MIVLDTNVVSEPLRPRPDPRVAAWLDRQAPETLFITTVSLAELLAGIAALPDGKRKPGLGEHLQAFLGELFAGRMLPFDVEAAHAFAVLQARARAAGATISFADGQIAAIASRHGFIVATRDEKPFRAAGVAVINPWTTR